MKAAVRSKYGSSKVLGIQELDIPIPKDDEVLIRVHAATVNRSDCHVLTGKPLLMRLFTGLFKPKLSITGCDFAGQIAATGKNVTSFKAGDKIMGFGGGLGCGSHAQYFTYPEAKANKAIVTMPGNISYSEAAACLEATFYGLNTVHSVNPQPGQKAMVNGATGGIGSAVVQFLKYYGVYVTATCPGEHSDLVRSLGADRIIDYQTQDFTKDKKQYDFVFDSVGRSTFFKCKPLLKKKGLYTSSDGPENLLLMFITPIFGGKKVIFRMPNTIKLGLVFIKHLVEKGNFRPVIDRKYPLEKIAEAFTYVASGKKIGNVILTMDA